jgi:lipopolysaccharide transport system permease protein
MNASFENPHIHLMEDGLRLKAGFEFTNHGAEDVLVGFQVFEYETGNVLIDGPRFAAVPAGSRQPVRSEIEIPAEDGRYQIFISPVCEDVAWGYELGQPFLLADVAVRSGSSRLLGWRVTTSRRLRFARFLRSAARAWFLPFAAIWRNRSLIRTMVRRDIAGRYRGSFGGAFWAVLNPLLLMATYFFVFGVVLQARFGQDPSRAGFALYFLAGMLPWMAFAEAVGRSPGLMLEHRTFLKKLVFPVETLPFNVVAAGLVSEAIALAVFMAVLFLARGAVPASAVWLPLIIVPQVLFTAGLCWFLAALGVFVRDLGQVIGFLLTLWFFLTPICYPEASLPPEAAAALKYNPINALVRCYRAVLLEGQALPFGATWKLWALGLLIFVLGHAWFYKLRRSFADII